MSKQSQASARNRDQSAAAHPHHKLKYMAIAAGVIGAGAIALLASLKSPSNSLEGEYHG